MNIFAWIGLIAIVVLSGFPLLTKKGRTKINIVTFVRSTILVLIILLLVYVLNISFLESLIVAFVLSIIFNKKTYTKKRLIIYGSCIAFLVGTVYFVTKSNPNRILNHLVKNEDSSSLYIAMNDEKLVSYNEDVSRPLASVVKTVIAIEYAYQIDDGTIDQLKKVPLSTLDQYYIEHTDGGAHEQWIEHMEDNQLIVNGDVTLHDIAKGMMTFSSNANTDYLIDTLGINNINKRLEELSLHDHDDIYPVVGALLVSQEHKNKNSDSQWIDELYNLSNDEYSQLALTMNEQLKNKDPHVPKEFDLTIKEQRVWSDRLPKASAETYGELLHMIATDQFPQNISDTVRELMEWPMEMVEGNKDLYNAIGAKGGSTAFVLNQAMYIDTLNDDLFEIVILMDDLSLWQSFLLGSHLNSFIVEIVNNKEFLKEVQAAL